MANENGQAEGHGGALAHAAAGAHDGAVHVHIATSRFYWGIFAALIVLTILTVKVSYYDFGQANIVIALLIATMKASLVATFFMHLRHDKLFNTVAFLGSFLFLAIFILLTYDDLGTRNKTATSYTGILVDPRSGVAAPGGEPATSATSDNVAEDAPPEAAGAKKDSKE